MTETLPLSEAPQKQGKPRPQGKWLKDRCGWLKNENRKARRNAPLTLTDVQVQKMIDEIEKMIGYTNLSQEEDLLIRYRDTALIATDWTFFKRGNEILHVRFGNVTITDKDLEVGIHILKSDPIKYQCIRGLISALRLPILQCQKVF